MYAVDSPVLSASVGVQHLELALALVELCLVTLLQPMGDSM